MTYQPTQQTDFDLSTSTDCREMLGGLLQAYVNVTAGNQRTRLRIGDRWSDFARGNAIELQKLYNIMYRQCASAGADMTGLPDLSPGLRAKRGPARMNILGPWPSPGRGFL